MPRGSRTSNSSEQGGKPRGGAPGFGKTRRRPSPTPRPCRGVHGHPLSAPLASPAQLLRQPPRLRPLKPPPREIPEQPPAPPVARKLGALPPPAPPPPPPGADRA